MIDVLPSTPPKPMLSVWIVNFNSSNCLANCIAGLTSERISRITILDNASIPAERRKLNSIAGGDRRISMIQSETNLGFGAAVNRIARSTRPRIDAGELIWILNPDTVVTPSATADLCDLITSDRADIVSPVILYGPPDDPVIWFAGGEIDSRRGRVRHVDAGLPASTGSRPPVLSSEFLTGAAPLMSRARWEELGGFREDLFLYWEDVDLSIRAQQAGLRTVVAGEVTIWHAEGGSSKTGSGPSEVTYFYSARNRILVCRQFGNAVGLAVGRGFPVLLRMAAVAFLKGGRGRITRSWAVVRGTIDGLQGRTGPRQPARRGSWSMLLSRRRGSR